MSWALFLLQDPETLQTYKEYAKESAYEAVGAQPPPPPNPPNRMHQYTMPIREGSTDRNHRTGHPYQDAENPYMGSTRIDVDRDSQKQTTPQRTPFYEDYTTTTSRGVPTADPPAGVHTENFYTPLYTKSQPTSHSDHTTANTNHRSPPPMRTYTKAVRDA